MSTYVSDTCSDSLEAICTSAYTDNPPFSCERVTYPTFVTIIATAFANASGVWSATVIALKLLLKLRYPHGYRDFDYDEERERFIPKNTGLNVSSSGKSHNPNGDSNGDARIHPMDVESGGGYSH